MGCLFYSPNPRTIKHSSAAVADGVPDSYALPAGSKNILNQLANVYNYCRKQTYQLNDTWRRQTTTTTDQITIDRRKVIYARQKIIGLWSGLVANSFKSVPVNEPATSKYLTHAAIMMVHIKAIQRKRKRSGGLVNGPCSPV